MASGKLNPSLVLLGRAAGELTEPIDYLSLPSTAVSTRASPSVEGNESYSSNSFERSSPQLESAAAELAAGFVTVAAALARVQQRADVLYSYEGAAPAPGAVMHELRVQQQEQEGNAESESASTPSAIHTASVSPAASTVSSHANLMWPVAPPRGVSAVETRAGAVGRGTSLHNTSMGEYLAARLLRHMPLTPPGRQAHSRSREAAPSTNSASTPLPVGSKGQSAPAPAVHPLPPVPDPASEYPYTENGTHGALDQSQWSVSRGLVQALGSAPLDMTAALTVEREEEGMVYAEAKAEVQPSATKKHGGLYLDLDAYRPPLVGRTSFTIRPPTPPDHGQQQRGRAKDATGHAAGGGPTGMRGPRPREQGESLERSVRSRSLSLSLSRARAQATDTLARMQGESGTGKGDMQPVPKPAWSDGSAFGLAALASARAVVEAALRRGREREQGQLPLPPPPPPPGAAQSGARSFAPASASHLPTVSVFTQPAHPAQPVPVSIVEHAGSTRRRMFLAGLQSSLDLLPGAEEVAALASRAKAMERARRVVERVGRDVGAGIELPWHSRTLPVPPSLPMPRTLPAPAVSVEGAGLVSGTRTRAGQDSEVEEESSRSVLLVRARTLAQEAARLAAALTSNLSTPTRSYGNNADVATRSNERAQTRAREDQTQMDRTGMLLPPVPAPPASASLVQQIAAAEAQLLCVAEQTAASARVVAADVALTRAARVGAIGSRPPSQPVSPARAPPHAVNSYGNGYGSGSGQVSPGRAMTVVSSVQGLPLAHTPGLVTVLGLGQGTDQAVGRGALVLHPDRTGMNMDVTCVSSTSAAPTPRHESVRGVGSAPLSLHSTPGRHSAGPGRPGSGPSSSALPSAITGSILTSAYEQDDRTYAQAEVHGLGHGHGSASDAGSTGTSELLRTIGTGMGPRQEAAARSPWRGPGYPGYTSYPHARLRQPERSSFDLGDGTRRDSPGRAVHRVRSRSASADSEWRNLVAGEIRVGRSGSIGSATQLVLDGSGSAHEGASLQSRPSSRRSMEGARIRQAHRRPAQARNASGSQPQQHRAPWRV